MAGSSSMTHSTHAQNEADGHNKIAQSTAARQCCARLRTGGGSALECQAVQEVTGVHQARNGPDVPASVPLQHIMHLLQLWHSIWRKANLVEGFDELLTCMLWDDGLQLLEGSCPGCLLLR